MKRVHIGCRSRARRGCSHADTCHPARPAPTRAHLPRHGRLCRPPGIPTKVNPILLDPREQEVFCLAIARPHHQLFASGCLVRNGDPLDILVSENGTHRHSRSVSSSCLNTTQNCLWGLFAVPTRQGKTPTRHLASSRCPHILSSHTDLWSRYSS